MSDRTRDLRLVEAMLFAAAEPLSEAQLATRLPDDADIPGLLAELREVYDGRGVHLVKVGRNWAFRTAPDLAEALRLETSTTRKLSRAAIETLSIIAYHQPVTRAEIEEIRGVSHSKGTLDVLLEAGWIKPGRRRLTPGRPVTWMTTPEFLDHFGLENIKDLPGIEELKQAGLLDARPAIQAFRGIVDPDAETDEGDEEADDADEAMDDDLAGDEDEIDLSDDEMPGRPIKASTDVTSTDLAQTDLASHDVASNDVDGPEEAEGRADPPDEVDHPDRADKVVRQAR